MPKKYSPEQSARNVALRKEKRKNDEYRESANQLERERYARLSLEKKLAKNARRQERRKNDEYRKREAQLERERIARMSPEQNAARLAAIYKQPHRRRQGEYNRRWRQKESPEKKRLRLDRANEWRRNNPEKISKDRWRRLVIHYGLSMAAFDALLLKQGGCCAICRTNTPRGRGGVWHVDHDHRTGCVRGLLCQDCNLAIGHVSDSVDILKRAIEYLSENGHGASPRCLSDAPNTSSAHL